jgi:ammonium transporter, Amt family
MEQQIADLTAKVTALEQSTKMMGTIDAEIFYWWCIAIMVLIHVGFLAYEMGASRKKNVLASGIKNILAFAFIVPTFYLFGWWIYNAFPSGLVPAEAAVASLPMSLTMGPNLSDNVTGIFWAAFALFAATTASIVSGAVIERIKLGAFLILAIVLGSVLWNLAAAWGWHPAGWLTTQFGYHDVGASGVVHMIAGFFTLGVLINLGARVGKFNADGTANVIAPHNMPLSIIGLMIIIVGFFGFLGGCIIFSTGKQWVNIYNQPVTLSAFVFSTLMGFAGGIIGAWMKTKDPFWMMSGALGGIIATAAALGSWYPPLAFLIGIFAGVTMPMVARLVEKAKIDDAVGAFSVHGYCGFLGLLFAGLLASGYPNVAEGAPMVSLYGQLVGAAVMALLGFIPGYVISLGLKMAGLLRVPDDIEEMGLDRVKVPVRAYPEDQPARLIPAE